MLPSSSFSDLKLEKNPFSGFLTLIKNFIINHSVKQEQLLRGGDEAITGQLLHLQIGHTQYLASLIIADRKYFRKKFGVQFFLDVM